MIQYPFLLLSILSVLGVLVSLILLSFHWWVALLAFLAATTFLVLLVMWLARKGSDAE